MKKLILVMATIAGLAGCGDKQTAATATDTSALTAASVAQEAELNDLNHRIDSTLSVVYFSGLNGNTPIYPEFPVPVSITVTDILGIITAPLIVTTTGDVTVENLQSYQVITNMTGKASFILAVPESGFGTVTTKRIKNGIETKTDTKLITRMISVSVLLKKNADVSWSVDSVVGQNVTISARFPAGTAGNALFTISPSIIGSSVPLSPVPIVDNIATTTLSVGATGSQVNVYVRQDNK